MKKIEFEAVFNNEVRKVEIAQTHGTGRWGLQLTVDKYYCGILVKRNGEWIAQLNELSLPEFTSTDIEILGQMIEASNEFDL